MVGPQQHTSPGTSSSRLQESLGRSWRRFTKRFAWYEELFRTPRADWKRYWQEIQSDDLLFDHLITQVKNAGLERDRRLGASIRSITLLGKIMTLGRFNPANAELYTLIRGRRPETVIETGVASGISSTLILAALSRNERGHLYSIDKPNRNEDGFIDSDGRKNVVFTPKGRRPGWLVPDRLRDRWTLLEGASFDLLPGLISKLECLDFFFHDSEHSYRNMWFEYEQASKALTPGGVLYSDDISWNSAFSDFATSHRGEYVGGLSCGGRGILVRM